MINIIACINNEMSIGKENKLLYKLPIDMERFKMLTTGSIVVMGLNTYKSIGRPLPNRLNVVLSYEPIKTYDNELWQMSFEEVIKLAQTEKRTIWVIGGGSIYKLFINKADYLYLTRVGDNFKGDTYFPDYDKEFNCIYQGPEYYDNGYACRFEKYQRRSNEELSKLRS